MWCTWQLSVPTIGFTCSDQRQARLEYGPSYGQLSQLDQLHSGLVDYSDLVGPVEALAAQLHGTDRTNRRPLDLGRIDPGRLDLGRLSGPARSGAAQDPVS